MVREKTLKDAHLQHFFSAVLMPSGFIVCILILLAPSSLTAQESKSLEILITDSASAATIANATIKITEIERNVLVDADGYASIKLKVGKYTLTVSSVGYRTKTTTVTVADRIKTILKIQLAAIDAMLKDVTVVGLSKEDAEARAIKQGVMPVTIITSKEIENRASNLNEILSKQVGVQVRQTGGLGGENRISVRGLEGKRVAIFIDGNPINTPDGSLGINDLPLQIIERIEIYKGAVPASFGSDGLGSAVNVVLKHRDISYIDVGLTRQSFNTTQLSFTGKKFFANKGMETGAGLFYTNAENNYKMESPFQKGVFIKRDHDKFHSFLSAAAIRFYKLWFDEIEIEGAYQKNFKQIQGIQQHIQHVERFTNSRFILIGLKKENFFSNRMKMLYYLNFDNYKTRFIDTSRYMYRFDGSKYVSTTGAGELGVGPNRATIPQHEVRHRFNLSYKMNEHLLLNLNNTLRSSEFSPQDSVANNYAGKNIYNYPGSVFNTTTGLTAEIKTLKEKLLISTALKIYSYTATGYNTNIFLITVPDKVTTKFQKTGYNAGVRYNFNNYTLIKGSYEHAVRVPLPFELFGDGLLTTPSLSLRPEIADNFNAGVIFDKLNNRQNRLQLEFNVFYSKVTDLIQLAGSLTNGYINYRNVNIVGGDVEIKADISDALYVHGNVAYQRLKDALRYTPGTQNVPNPTYKIQIPNTPSFFTNWAVEYHKDNLLGKATKTRCIYEGSYVAEYSYAFNISVFNDLVIPSYVSHNFIIEQEFKNNRYTITGEVQNFTNEKILNNLNLPLPGRSLRVKFRCLLFEKTKHSNQNL